MAVRTLSAPNDQELYIAAASLLADRIEAALAHRKHCVLGIVGGRSIPALLDKLLPYAPQLRGRIDIFWLDERVSDEKNYIAALPHLEHLHRVGVDVRWYPFKSTHRVAMDVELSQTLQALTESHGEPAFDIVVLSAGEDGHIASLFPHNPVLERTDLAWAHVENAPKPPSSRVSVTAPLLITAKEGFLFFVGEKRAVYERFLDPHLPIEDCPAKLALKIPDLTVLTALK